MWGINWSPAGILAFKELCSIYLVNMVYNYIHCHSKTQDFTNSQSCLTGMTI